MPFAPHEECFESAPPEARRLLQEIQAKVEALLPHASRCISYNMPAFKHERVFFYFAAFKKHIGVYPPVTQDAALIKELAAYRGDKVVSPQSAIANRSDWPCCTCAASRVRA
jgi:uncharacterized protein YdhG (YjbR/CyaY superfamily)